MVEFHCVLADGPPERAVFSPKSQRFYEKNLIEKYISNHGTDPVSGDELSVQDLIDVQTTPIVRPRPPTQTSIPALLATFQNEWDALALRSYELRKKLEATQQELSTALYDYEGALRVIARVTEERDQLKSALSKVRVTGGGDGMDIDGREIPKALSQELQQAVDTAEADFRKRRKAKGSKASVTPDEVGQFKSTTLDWIDNSALKGCASLSVGGTLPNQIVVYGNENGSAIISGSDGSSHQVSTGSKITDSVVCDGKAIIASSDGSVKIFDGPKEIVSYKEHNGAVQSLALHPSGQLFASVGADGKYFLYSLESLESNAVASVDTGTELTACEFHPDGSFLAVSDIEGYIKIFGTKDGIQNQILYKANDVVQALSFSSNGYLLASGSDTSVDIWSLRATEEEESRIHAVDFEAKVSELQWDPSGQYLAIIGGGSLGIGRYEKKKPWTELLRKDTISQRLSWDPSGKALFADSGRGVMLLKA